MAMIPCGTFNSSYAEDMAVIRTRFQWGLLIALLLFLFAIPLFANERLLNFMIMLAITIISVQGLNILTGYAGQLSLGQSAFMAVGAYTSAMLTVNLGWSFWAALPCAGLSAAITGIIFGLPAARIKGFYLAMATLAAHFIIIYFILVLPDYTGGAVGMPVSAPQLGSISLAASENFYFVAVGLAVIMTYFTKSLVRTKPGRAFIAIRDNDIAANVMGINIFSYKLLAFAICSFYAGIAGSLLVHYIRYATTDAFPLMNAIWYVGMIIIGGLGSVLGSILGVLMLNGLGEVTSMIMPWMSSSPLGVQRVASLTYIFYAVVIMLFIIFEPRGLAHRWEIFKTSYRGWPFSYTS